MSSRIVSKFPTDLVPLPRVGTLEAASEFELGPSCRPDLKFIKLFVHVVVSIGP